MQTDFFNSFNNFLLLFSSVAALWKLSKLLWDMNKTGMMRGKDCSGNEMEKERWRVKELKSDRPIIYRNSWKFFCARAETEGKCNDDMPATRLKYSISHCERCTLPAMLATAWWVRQQELTTIKSHNAPIVEIFGETDSFPNGNLCVIRMILSVFEFIF